MSALASLVMAACLVLTHTRHIHEVEAKNLSCWVSGDLAGDNNPVDVYRALCGSTDNTGATEQEAVLR
jgi:hypothetical protein